MVNFSKKTLQKIESDTGLSLDPIAKSPSMINVGDVLTFKYLNKNRMVLVVQPVAKCPETGNLLLTCVNVSPTTEFTKETLKDLYKNRASLGEDQYRTYIFSKMQGILRRLYSKDSEMRE